MSIVEFNAATHDLQTVSMHYYEQDRFQDGFDPDECSLVQPKICADPTQSCAVMRVYDGWFAVVPFRRQELLRGMMGAQDDDEGAGEEEAADDELKGIEYIPFIIIINS